jgi:hypothetical protein
VPGEFNPEGAALLVYAVSRIRRHARLRAMGEVLVLKYGQMRSKRAPEPSFREVFLPFAPSPDSGSGGC